MGHLQNIVSTLDCTDFSAPNSTAWLFSCQSAAKVEILTHILLPDSYIKSRIGLRLLMGSRSFRTVT